MYKYLSWSLVGQLSTIIFQFIGLVILSKMLPASDYGIMGTMFFFMNIADLLIDSGMGGALIYKKSPTETDFSTLFLFNLLMSVFLYVILFVSSGFIANFYDTPEICSYIKLYGLSIILIALCIVQDCKLKREMKFKELSLITIIASVISLALAVYLAYKGFGVYALILQSLSFLLCRVIGLYLVCGFLKSFSFSKQSFKEQFSFGGWLFLANVVQSACNNIYSNIIPKIGTYTENGYYTQSAKISTVPTNTIAMTVGNVFFPYLASKESEEELVKEARRIHRKMYHLSFPLLFLLPVFSNEIIMIVLGEEWRGASFFLRILLFAGIFDLMVAFMRNLLKSAGKTRAISNLEIIKTVIRIISIIISLFWGMKMLIYSILLASVINAIISSLFVSKNIRYSIKDQLSDYSIPILFSGILMISTFFVYKAFFFHSLWSITLIAIGYFLYFVILIIVRNADVIEMKELAIDKYHQLFGN